MTARKLLIASSALLPTFLATASAHAGDATRAGKDATSAAVAALEANLGKPAGLEIDEVRVTDKGIACIDYRVGNSQGGKVRGHAVIQDNEVLKSSSDDKRFQERWNQHCLGPRGGITGVE